MNPQTARNEGAEKGLRREILARISSVAAIPTASAELIRLLQDPEESNAKLVQAIEFDPSLTSNILRLANSAYFGFPRSVSTVREALFLLGRNEIFQLVVASIVGKMARHAVRGYGLTPAELWDHLMGVAIATEGLGKLLGRRVPPYAFTAGLLHDIGKVVLGSIVEVDAAPVRELVEREGIPWIAAERRLLGIDHAEVGARLLESWNLPPYLTLAVRWHHEPERGGEGGEVARLILLADALCVTAGIGAGVDGCMGRMLKEIIEEESVPARVGEQVIQQVLTELEDLRCIFQG